MQRCWIENQDAKRDLTSSDLLFNYWIQEAGCVHIFLTFQLGGLLTDLLEAADDVIEEKDMLLCEIFPEQTF